MKRKALPSFLFSLLALLLIASFSFLSTGVLAMSAASEHGLTTEAMQGMYSTHERIHPNSTPDFQYQGGPIMTGTVNVYIIYWFPQGFSDQSSYKSLLNRYYSDVGGNRLYNMLKQYTDSNGDYPSGVNLAGTWVDTQAYPHANRIVKAATSLQIKFWRRSNMP